MLSMLAVLSSDEQTKEEQLLQEAQDKAEMAVKRGPGDPYARLGYGLVLLNSHHLAPNKKDKTRLLTQAWNKFQEARVRGRKREIGATGLAFVAALQNDGTRCRHWLRTAYSGEKISREELEYYPWLKDMREEQWFSDFLAEVE